MTGHGFFTEWKPKKDAWEIKLQMYNYIILFERGVSEELWHFSGLQNIQQSLTRSEASVVLHRLLWNFALSCLFLIFTVATSKHPEILGIITC